MRIKKLEIVGFKSFCDRTVLTFDSPVTGIVGPNGCGKSNIVDAIRWCMGEQSAKHLRGKAMDDVIFNGSDSRKPSGMCEVSLTFENDGRAPVDYLAYSEITVTRRLFRDGTSEYLLNKTPCRLRDITDFFLGTGVGARAYAIIEQGRVGMIVSSKPEDRRALIEEAAGITKFKAKKKAAEKKMDSTRQNLLRVSDVVAEIEKQLGSLRRQAQKAERYKQYKAEVRDIEMWSASQRWLGYHAEERVTGAALSEAGAAREAAHSSLAAREAGIEAERLGSAEEVRRIELAQEGLYELDNRIRLGEAQADHESKQAGGLEDRVTSARAELEQLGRQIENADEELVRLRAEAAASDEGTAGQGEALLAADEEVRVLKQKSLGVQQQIEEAKQQIARAQAEIARGESADRSQLRRLEDLELRLGRIGEEQGRLAGREGELRAEMAGIDEQLDGLRQSRVERQERGARLEARLVEVREEQAAVEQEVDGLTADLHKRRSRHHSLIEIQQRYEGFARGTRAVMKKQGSDEGERWGIRGLVADVIRAPAEYEVAVEAALGERLGSIVVESHEAALDGVEYLKAHREGRTGFVPLRVRPLSLPEPGEGGDLPSGEDAPSGLRGAMLDLVSFDDEFAVLARALLGDVVIVDDLLTALDLWKGGARRTFVTVDGEVIDPRGLVAGGSRGALNADGVEAAGVLAQKRELRELDTLIADLAARHAAGSERLAALKGERAEIQATLETLRRDAHAGEMAILTADKDLARHREELARLATRGQVIGGERDDLTRQRDEATVEAEETRIGLRQARAQLIAAEDTRDQRGRESVALIDRLEEGQALLTDLRVRSAQVEEKRRALARALMTTDGLRGDHVARRERLGKSMGEWAEEARALRGMVTARREELQRLAVDSRARAEELSQARAAYETRRVTLMQAEAEAKSARSRVEKAGHAVAELELKLHDARIARTHLEEQIADRYRVRLIDQLHDHHLRPTVGEAEETRLGELRDLIDRMGEINLTAIDEYNALEQRYTFLCTQKGDLEKALAQLEEAIAQINRTSKKRFREVFDLVNQKFQELFPRLFRGGRAYLTLTNEEDLLESGIEIFAQPPGKKNATVELLSGGEKALTAVSLVFAIFLIKPSPFCLLDEVDAPLDEANVGRFNDLVRAMTDRSQFIMITHNKRTMEITDTLFGVTQEEPGISKLVSVNLSVAGGGQKAA